MTNLSIEQLKELLVQEHYDYREELDAKLSFINLNKIRTVILLLDEELQKRLHSNPTNIFNAATN